MSKNITTSLLTGIQSQVATLAIIVSIKLDNGGYIRLTNHDEDLVIGGETYTSDIPFVLSAIDGGSSLSADTGELSVAVDGFVFTDAEIRFGAFKNAEVMIGEVDYTNPTAGIMTLRKGWIANADQNKNKVAKFEISGLLTILDLSVGRVLQPSCDADLGDKRCRVAVDLSQAYSFLNRYEVGDWVYHYEPGAMGSVTVVNGSFGSGGAKTASDPIPGWTRGPGSVWVVNSTSPYQGALTAHPSAADAYFLEGYPDTDPEGEETYVYQDIDLSTATSINMADLDDGQIVIAFFVKFRQTVYLLDKPRIVVDVLAADGSLIERNDTDYFEADQFEVWREKAMAFSLLPGARTLRIYLYAIRLDADVVNVVFDDVRAGWWNHTVSRPYSDVIHKVSRIINTADGYMDYTLPNSSFEIDGALANSSAGNISRWSKAPGSFWRVASSVGAQGPRVGTYMLVGGDDSSGVQQTYTISQSFSVQATKLDLARVALGKSVGRIEVSTIFGDTTSQAGVTLEFYTATNVLISTLDVYSLGTPGAVGYVDHVVGFSLPPTCRSIKLKLTAKSPVGSSAANVGFDRIKFQFFDGDYADKKDPINAVSGRYLPATTFNSITGTYTVDSYLVWKAHSVHLQYDEVLSVVDKKNFRATFMTGGEGAFETGAIRWISGANAGARNIIRVWDPVDKDIRLYFQTVFPIQPGDRFTYIRPCQKRFLEDCFTRFDNGINFQGFPYLPSTTSG